MYDAGYSSSSRLYERTASQLGMTPDKYRRGAIAAPIRYTTTDSPLGRMMIAATDKGVCSIQFADTDDELEHGLRHEFPFAVRKRDDATLETWETECAPPDSGRAFTFVAAAGHSSYSLSAPGLDIFAIHSHRRNRSYAQVAKAIGQPTATRAVARACATNPVAVAIPCHRIVRTDGAMGGYRWGMERKRALLELEREQAR